MKIWRRGGIVSVVAEWEVTVGERWYVSCFQRDFYDYEKSLVFIGVLMALKSGEISSKISSKLDVAAALDLACRFWQFIHDRQNWRCT